MIVISSEHVFSVESGEEEEQLQQVTVKFARTESERLKKAREKSFGFLQKKNAEELWIPTEFYPYESEECVVSHTQAIDLLYFLLIPIN